MQRCASALALAAAGVLLAGGDAFAQMRDGLRGEVQETAITTDLLGRYPRTLTNTSPLDGSTSLVEEPAARRYSPVSSGAIDDDAAPAPTSGLLGDGLAQGGAQTGAEPVTRTGRSGAANPGESAPTANAATEEDLTTGTVRAAPVDGFEEDRSTRIGPDGERAGAIDALSRTPEPNPYGPLGLRVGTFELNSTLEQGIGWTSNANLTTEARSSTYSETGLRLNAVSDWSRHSARIDGDVRYRKSLGGEEISDAEGGVNGELRLELGDQWNAFASGGYRVSPESASSPSTVTGAVSRPLRHTFTGSAGLSRDVGRVRLGMYGDVARNVYGDARLENGDRLSQSDRDSTLSTLRLRTGYEISPALRPFVEAEIGRRSYDEAFDRDGYERSADRYALRSGFELDMGEKLRGEIAAGWVSERPEDARLDEISGLSLAANLAWSPVHGTTVELNGSTEVEGSTVAGKSGSLYHSGSVSLTRQLRHDLTGSVLAGIGWREYFGHDETDLVLRGEASLTWWMNRYAGITGRASYESQRGTLPDRDYDATSVYLGMTLQR